MITLWILIALLIGLLSVSLGVNLYLYKLKLPAIKERMRQPQRWDDKVFANLKFKPTRQS